MMFHTLLCRLVQGNLSKIHGHKCLANGVHPDGVLNNMNETKGLQNAVSCKGKTVIAWIQICLAGVKLDAHSKNMYMSFLSSLLNVQVQSNFKSKLIY